MDIKMKTEDVQEAIREYYIRRGYTRDRLVDIHIKGGRKVKGNDIPNNGTVELTLMDTYISPIEDDIIPPPTFNAASEDVSGLVSELEEIMDESPVELSEDKQLELLLDIADNLPMNVAKPVTAGSKFKSLFS
jgi:hypothetical protein|tara:strand:+ start:1214 stop:1612 length:399 start_codon:yes stop_codon:yes gene_type:complete